MSFVVVYTEEAIEEINNILNSKKFYLDSNGNLLYSTNTDIVEYTLKSLTS